MDLGAAMALTAALWGSLPHGDSASDLLETVVPFTFTEPMDTGGTLTGVPPFVGAQASSWRQTSFRLGLADVTDPATGGRPLLYPDLSAIGALHVKPAGSVLDAGAPGTVVTLTPTSGGTAWTRDVALAWAPPPLQSDGSSDVRPVARLRGLARLQATAGGPLPAHMHLFAAAAVTRSSHVEREQPYRLPGNVLSLVVRPTFSLRGERRAGITGWIQRTDTAFAARALLRDRQASASQWYGGVAASWAGGVRRAVELSAAVASTGVTPRPASTAVRGAVERLVDDPIEVLVNEAVANRTRQTLAATLTTGDRLRLTGGASLSGSRMHVKPFGTGPIGETIDGVPARIWDYGLTGEPRRSETTVAMFASAERALSGTLRGNAGIRVEHVGASALGAGQGIHWTSLEPRLLLHYARGPISGEIVARRYHPTLPLTILANGDPAAGFGRSYLWTDRNGDGQPQVDERGTLVALVGPGSPSPGFSTIDPALRRPYADELMAALELRVGAWAAVQFSAVSRRGAALLGRFDPAVPFDAYGGRYQFDPGLNLGGAEDDQMLPVYSRPPSTFGADRYLLTNVAGVSSTYGGIYLGARFECSPRWSLRVGGTALRSRAPAGFGGYLPSENDEMAVGDAYSDPNANTYAEGRSLFDRGYGLKVSATYNARARLSFSTAARYADGQNFARLVVVPDLPQGRDVVRAYANGRSKFTYTMTVDLRAQQIVTWRSRDITLALEAYNSLNLHNEVEEVTISGPDWRKATFAQPPRVIRFTAAVKF
jgi:hypothetical protein